METIDNKKRVKKLRLKYAAMGFCLGILAAGLVYLAERTMPQVAWLLIGSFPLTWGVAGYIFSFCEV